MNFNPIETNTWVPLTIQEEGETLINFVQATDEFVIDSFGNSWIDAIASWWTMIFGHRHPKLVLALEKQLKELDHIMLAGHIHPPAESLSKVLLELTNSEFHKVFYSDNGSNAIEIALKLSVQFYQNHPDYKPRSEFLVFSNSYHGDSIGAMNVSGKNYFNRIYSELRFPTKEFPAPNCMFCPWGKSANSCHTECLSDLELAIKQKEYVGIVIEPLVFGANGMLFYDKKVLVKLRELATATNTLLIFDEVFTGMGRLGEFFAYQKAGVKPDLLVMAKGLTGGMLPLGATLVSKFIYEQFLSKDPYKAFFHAHTMTGNPLACSVGYASVKLLKETGLGLVKKLEASLQKRIEPFQKTLGNRIKNVRVMGGIFAFEFQETIAEDEYLNPVGRRIREKMKEYRVLIRPLGRTIYITPPYTISENSLDQIFLGLEQTLLSFAESD
ncbi:adenosylmethionine--8-amino-7-oxononanoate transaminase [Leptospira kanakyensis]|uniref:Adenosylmethionine-8-amino-7-oxononanoate aminotransferase n=1 Tax=Leptospira kanakyensis TaxID=2484968 RepID=A0A6N4Q8L9_9LEPT|nr:adenosylmethionine--8-amino-7-oxononanoate transaminase [Leptospira kanakyensis]MCW7469977.1 adenosylmethionine--8-amino-7-oxononanoate transaminase [Leptospira kanakyensis]MCW7480960.1 adenosylmethionine--8-amino-7-oxononanoate transaminase [Leptospira kanakyensis]TGK47755.1 adenosylmethionine--8-amino-7-oxononanoate transaminase [Leptospira kanakyensis]TGK63245.1 adenosylmethionine--8-amino-7-oxononanoate transaminase [Leptospira kanakyensis]TGK66852.1 adenosylmethionine--8-amino-7-oxonon